jgi:hypothetical protein
MSSVTFCCSQIVLYIYIFVCVCVCVCVCVNQQTLWRWLCWLKGRELGGMGSIWATGKHMITNVKLPQTTFMFFQNLKSRLYDLSSGWKTQEERIDELIMGQIGLRFWDKRPTGRYMYILWKYITLVVRHMSALPIFSSHSRTNKDLKLSTYA